MTVVDKIHWPLVGRRIHHHKTLAGARLGSCGGPCDVNTIPGFMRSWIASSTFCGGVTRSTTEVLGFTARGGRCRNRSPAR